MQDFMAAAMQDQPRLTALKAQILRQIKQPAPYYVFDMRWLIDAQLYASVLHETQQWWQTDACAVSGSRGFELKKAFEPCFAPVSNWLQPILTAIVFDASAGYLPSAVRSLECRTKFILSASACDNTEPGPAHVDGPVIIATLTLVGPSTQLFPYVAAPPRSRQGMNVAVTATDTYLEPGVGHLLIFFGLTQSARPAVVHRAPGAFHRLALITGLSFVRSQLSRNDALIV